MKKFLVCFTAILFLFACAEPKTLPTADGGDTKLYTSYGLFNTHHKASHVCYRIVAGNVVWSMLLASSFIFPLYFVGWSIFEPTDLKKNVENPEGCW